MAVSLEPLRPLRSVQVLFISANPDAYHFQPDNAIKLKEWKVRDCDATLMA